MPILPPKYKLPQIKTLTLPHKIYYNQYNFNINFINTLINKTNQPTNKNQQNKQKTQTKISDKLNIFVSI